MSRLRDILGGLDEGEAKLAFFETLARDLGEVGAGRNDPVQSILVHASNYWGAAILYILQAGPFRHGTLRQLLCLTNPKSKISQRMLTLNLRILERDGMIERRVRQGSPTACVDYRLTEAGSDMVALLAQVIRWAIGHSNTIKAARAEFDSRDSTEHCADHDDGAISNGTQPFPVDPKSVL